MYIIYSPFNVPRSSNQDYGCYILSTETFLTNLNYEASNCFCDSAYTVRNIYMH